MLGHHACVASHRNGIAITSQHITCRTAVLPLSHRVQPCRMHACISLSVSGGETCASSRLSLTWASCCRAGRLQWDQRLNLGAASIVALPSQWQGGTHPCWMDFATDVTTITCVHNSSCSARLELEGTLFTPPPVAGYRARRSAAPPASTLLAFDIFPSYLSPWPIFAMGMHQVAAAPSQRDALTCHRQGERL